MRHVQDKQTQRENADKEAEKVGGCLPLLALLSMASGYVAGALFGALSGI